MSTIVIMPGGFHPFHAGHAALYNSALKAFPGADVYVAATDDTTTRPFPFQIKEKLAQLAGVSKGRFMRVKSPFQAKEITAPYNPEKDRLIFVRSEKDASKPPQAGGVKKDGSPSYLQPLAGQTNIRPFKEHAYMAYLPTVEFGPGMTSATEIRTAWPKLNDRRKTALVMSLYPATQKNPALAANVVKMLDTAIGSDLTESGMLGHVMFRSKPPKLKKIQPAVSRTKDFMKKDFSLSENLNEFAPGGGEGNGPFDYGRAIVEIGEDFSQQYNDPGAEADAKAIIRVGQTFMSGGMTAGIRAFYSLDTQVRDHVAEQLTDQGFNVRQDIYAKGPMAPSQRDAGAEDQKNILALLKAFIKTRTEPEDRKAVSEIYKAFQQDMSKGFAALYNAWEFDIDADFIDFAMDYGVDINAIAEKYGQQDVTEGLDDDESVLYHFAEVLADELGYDPDEVAENIVSEMTTPSGLEVYTFTDDDQTYYMGVLRRGKGSAIVSVSHAGGGQDNELEIYGPGENLKYIVKYGRTGPTLHTPDNKVIAQAKPGQDENDLVGVALDMLWGRMKQRFMEQGVAEDADQPTFHVSSYDDFNTAFEVEMVIDNNNAGFFSYQYFPKTNDVENDVDIHSASLRGQGLGKLLLLKAIETAQEHNLPFKADRNGVTPEQGHVYKSLLRDGIIKLNPDKTFTTTGRSLNEFAPAGGAGGDNYGGDLYDILMGYIQQTYPDLMDHFGQDTVDSTVSDMVVMGTFGDIDPSDEDDLEDAVSQIIAQLEDSALDENQGWAATFTNEESGQMAGTPASTGMWAGYQRRENQPIDEDYIEEKWSQKYKRSINCSNPRGFSQKAHCAGRKK